MRRPLRAPGACPVVLFAAGLFAGADRSAAADVPAAAPCIPGGLSLTATAQAPGPYPPQTTAVYDVTVSDLDSGACGSRELLFAAAPPPPNVARYITPSSALVGPGDAAQFFVSLTGTTDAVPGHAAYPFTVRDAVGGDSVSGQLDYEMLPPSGCFVSPARELMITDLSVVEDPIRTSAAPPSDPRVGAWTFARLAERAAPAPRLAASWVESWLRTWLVDQSINSQTVPARPAMAPFLLDRWPHKPDGSLDLAQAPLRLLAIVDRLDLRSVARGDAGQGRFIFGVTDAAGLSAPFTIIMEYTLSVSDADDVLSWARAWHVLGAVKFPSETYNSALQVITDGFTSRGARPRGVNASALAAVRTDELQLGSPWELRQFAPSPSDGLLHETTVDQTPNAAFMGSGTLANYVNTQASSILAGGYVVPATFEGMPFAGASAPNTMTPWTAAGIQSATARRVFSIGTCNGCHTIPETGTEFVHVKPRQAGTASLLSGFLLGAATPDPMTGQLETFNDLGRRKADLEALVCGCTTGATCATASNGIYRVH